MNKKPLKKKSFGLMNIVDLFSKPVFRKYFIIVALLIIIVLFGLFIRLQPITLNVTDDWARNSVYSFYRSNIESQINSQYPNLPQQNKNVLIDKTFSDFLNTNSARIEQEIAQSAQSFKTRLQYNADGETQTYLGDLDSYYYLRQARNIINKGTACDAMVDGVCYDTYLVAPLGAPLNVVSLHPYAIAFLYKVFAIFSQEKNQEVLLLRASYFVPVILAILMSVFAFFFGRKISGNLGGLFAAILVTVSQILISRTSGSDTDIWNVFSPVLIVWLFFEAFTAKSWKSKVIFTALSALSIAFFSFAWVVWWYIFDFLLLAGIAYMAYLLLENILAKKKLSAFFKHVKLKTTAILLATFFVLSGIFVSLVSGFSSFFNFFTGPFGIQTLKSATHSTLWPNIFTTVAELNEANLSAIVSQSGGKLLFFLALLGGLFWLIKRFKFNIKDSAVLFSTVILYIILLNSSVLASINTYVFFFLLILPLVVAILIYGKNLSDRDVQLSLLIIIWLIGTIFASLKGIRFILLLIPILSISAGAIIALLYTKISEFVIKFTSIQKSLVKNIVFVVIFLIVFLALFYNPAASTGYVTLGYAASKSFVPSISDAWVESLQKIKAESEPDAIINSWWDFGHWFKYWADRRVTLDGVTQNSPQAQWLGTMIQSSNEDETIGIMRMLDCGSNRAFDEVNKKYEDTEFSVALLRRIILEDKQGAEKILEQEGFSSQETERILQNTHCEPPEDYFITSGDMVGKASVWGHFGTWNFSKAWMANNIRQANLPEAKKLFFDRYGDRFSEQEFNDFYFELQGLSNENEVNAWISPWPGYFSSSNNCEPVPMNQTNVSDGIRCFFNTGLGNSGNQRVVLDYVIVFPDKMNYSIAHVSGFDTASGALIGDNFVTMEKAVFGESDKTELKSADFANPGISFGVIVTDYEDGTYASVVSDPLLLESTFTKLYFLDGAHTKHFEKFSDLTTVFGNRIIVWKVNWNP